MKLTRQRNAFFISGWSKNLKNQSFPRNFQRIFLFDRKYLANRLITFDNKKLYTDEEKKFINLTKKYQTTNRKTDRNKSKLVLYIAFLLFFRSCVDPFSIFVRSFNNFNLFNIRQTKHGKINITSILP